MDRRNIERALGVLLVGIALWVLQLVISGLSLLALIFACVWLSYRIAKRLVAPLGKTACKQVDHLWRWWWRKLWEDPLEEAQREALREIQKTIHYYVEVQSCASQWADAQEDQTAAVRTAV